MKLTITVLVAFFIASSVAQWPCHDFGWNGAIANCASCNILGTALGAGSTSTFSVCTNCTSGFFLNQSACIPCTNNCTSCYTNGACMPGGCAPGFAFYKTNFSCVACPASLNCQTCNYNTQAGNQQIFGNGPFACTSCNTAYAYISAATGACTACTATACNDGNGATSMTPLNSTYRWAFGTFSGSGCSGNVCSSCAAGYYSSASVCTACTAGCISCTSAATCTTCGNGYYGSGTATCTSCTTAAPNCLNCLSAATCGTCVSGFYPITNTNCTTCIANCAICAGATTPATQCTVGGCSSGYYLNSGTTCTQCSANCTGCQDYSAVVGATPAGLCYSCKANTTISNGACYACPANCTSCALTSSSATTTVCLQCQLGFGLNDTTGVCIQCPANCDYCDGNGVCTSCRQGAFGAIGVVPATASSGNSQFSVPITQGYFLPPNQCQQCPYNCSSCANSTYCYNNCTKNYLYNATTAQCLPNGAERIVLAGFAIISVLFYFI